MKRTEAVHNSSILFITLDSCRYDTFTQGPLEHLGRVGPVYRAFAPGTFTYSSHLAMFMGFTPGLPELCEPYVNPKWAKIFRLAGGPSHENCPPFASLHGTDLVAGLHQLGYSTFGTGAVRWFDTETPTSQVLTRSFDEFFYPGNSHSLRRQLQWAQRLTQSLADPFFLFINIGETHVPYYYEGAPWPRMPSPCVPFGATNDAAECRRRQRACLEFVDQELGPLLERFRRATVIVCADHGDVWGEDGLWEHGIHHPMVYEVPLAFHLGSPPPGTGPRSPTRRRHTERRSAEK